MNSPLLPDRYELGFQIGTGGFGSVWAAADNLTGAQVAVKIPKHRDSDTLSQFRREAEVTSAITHENVVRTLDYSIDPAAPYLAMELIDGHTLSHKTNLFGPMAPEQIVSIAKQISAGLDAVHSAEVIHRDVSPANVMLDREGTAKLMDFGLATYAPPQFRDTFPLIATPGYMAPERLHGQFGTLEQRGGPQSDLYSLGAVMRHMMTGLPIIPGEKLEDLGGLRPDTSRELRALVEQLMMPDPADRPRSAAETHNRLAKLSPHSAATSTQAPSLTVARGTRRAASAAPTPNGTLLALAATGIPSVGEFSGAGSRGSRSSPTVPPSALGRSAERSSGNEQRFGPGDGRV
ncbi:hypothetical protein GCM10023205_45810 [Yinghuangia aomiensis]|uniref:non-specific serine/threonine protein kinase n=1 Tax=Yinghuangia aomiensis TaxID=676205 RepID=A0ABP9HN02_9ACTN